MEQHMNIAELGFLHFFYISFLFFSGIEFDLLIVENATCGVMEKLYARFSMVVVAYQKSLQSVPVTCSLMLKYCLLMVCQHPLLVLYAFLVIPVCGS